MNPFETLLTCSGTWEGLNSVQASLEEPPNTSPSEIVITPMLRGSFVRLDQTWTWNDEPQSGSMLIGYDPEKQEVAIGWVDTWHNGRRIMPLAGRFEPGGKLIANGSFPAGDGPDWGWRIEIHAAADELKVDMFCLDPDGKEQGGVRGNFACRK